MNTIEIILTVVIAAAALAALIAVIRNRKNKGCAHGCDNCVFPCSENKKNNTDPK